VSSQNVRYRIILLAALTLVATVYLVPTFVTGLPQFWRDYLPSRKLSLGLDLQGGTHLVMTVEVDKALANSLERTAEYIERAANEEEITGVTAKRENENIIVQVSPANRDKLADLLENSFGDLTVQDSTTVGDQARLVLALVPAASRSLVELTLDQALETIRNRIDQFGVTEPIIQREGSDGILIQLPGIQDPQRAKDLIGRTAVLELKLLPREAMDVDAYVSGQKPLPEGLEILEGIDSNTGPDGRTQRRKTKYIVESKTLLTGDTITHAQPRPGQTGLDSPYVEFELNSQGADQFERITGANVDRQLAIVLDKTVYSAPRIKDRIPGGRAIIEGNFTLPEARDLAIVLRAGALPAPVRIDEERTVGPSLGQDSIDKGVLSFMVGGVLVVVFMVVYYKFAGVLADVAVLLNVLFLLATLAVFQATLTLPGIAGIVLTVGMAVDANVLINERIREELRLGKSARAAIEAGYERALPAILDSNITTFLAGVILFQFGSGPVKGFAVTLCIGIVSTVFTAVVGTRTVYDYLLSRRRLQTVSI
jgi:preprotein translocase subunit SecD